MDDVTNTLGAAATAAQPSVRVRVVDATTRQTMNDLAEVVFVPCADSEPIKIANAALSELPARRYLVKATAPGYAQLNYLEGPINIYHDHLVVDQEGRPQKEVVIEMERRVAAVWLSVTDCRDGKALPTASVHSSLEMVPSSSVSISVKALSSSSGFSRSCNSVRGHFTTNSMTSSSCGGSSRRLASSDESTALKKTPQLTSPQALTNSSFARVPFMSSSIKS